MMLRGAISDAVIFCGGQASDTDERQWSMASTRRIEVGRHIAESPIRRMAG
jgi:hypothetical protein